MLLTTFVEPNEQCDYVFKICHICMIGHSKAAQIITENIIQCNDIDNRIHFFSQCGRINLILAF
jgi:hypothetical protein